MGKKELKIQIFSDFLGVLTAKFLGILEVETQIFCITARANLF